MSVSSLIARIVWHSEAGSASELPAKSKKASRGFASIG